MARGSQYPNQCNIAHTVHPTNIQPAIIFFTRNVPGCDTAWWCLYRLPSPIRHLSLQPFLLDKRECWTTQSGLLTGNIHMKIILKKFWNNEDLTVPQPAMTFWPPCKSAHRTLCAAYIISFSVRRCCYERKESTSESCGRLVLATMAAKEELSGNMKDSKVKMSPCGKSIVNMKIISQDANWAQNMCFCE